LSTRLEIGRFNGADTVWSVFLGLQPSGCSSDLATSVLVVPVISSDPVRQWPNSQAAVALQDGDSCVVTYNDLSTGTLVTFRYTVDVRHWVVRRLEKSATISSRVYALFDASYAYDWIGDTLPVLNRIAHWNDTTLAKGGYRFYNIGINAELDDTLFQLSVWNGGRMTATDRSLFPAVYGGVFDLRGRRFTGNPDADPAAGRVSVRESGTATPRVWMRKRDDGPD